jgi:hypothetical protein
MMAVRAGIASALLNASREVAGLLGITVIGAVLSTRRAAALRSGAPNYVEHRPAAEITVAGELEAVGESLGELAVPARADR